MFDFICSLSVGGGGDSVWCECDKLHQYTKLWIQLALILPSVLLSMFGLPDLHPCSQTHRRMGSVHWGGGGGGGGVVDTFLGSILPESRVAASRRQAWKNCFLYRVAQKERNSRFSGLCSNQQLLSSLCWIEHLFPIIITSRSSNLVENFLFYETFLMDCHFRDLPDFQSFEARWQINGNPTNDSRLEITHKIKSFQPNLMILVLL